ncbi:helix-turn-helix transcriptional regulator [Paenibacillus kobensis]|uniref:helix-turn-helix transcriptional regulator n=1 Tax=Paenibacillus kobensis TaxID=59841 RepID=UPI000FD780E0|nr:WYL domain-containing protein [Paenibacillus kobensis]
MKIDRLYAITVYLLNHGKASASELARRFEVSSRTIQRDIDSLCRAGIPVVALTGAAGGYEIMDTFGMRQHAATQEDYSHILTALQGLATATNDPKVNATLDKLASVSKAGDSTMILDFSVVREGDEKMLQLLQSAVHSKRAVQFTYTNANAMTLTHTVEPIAVLYRWYAWYLLAYSTVKNDYRTYKLVRMNDLLPTDITFTREHESAEAILRAADETDTRIYMNVTIRCKAEAKARAIEYLRGTITEELDNGDVLMTLNVVENEHFWYGTMLALGDSVEILTPEKLRIRVLESAKSMVSLYDKL